MKKKKGMSIAAVLGIMVCLVATVTTCFILAIRSSILTSRSLKYIESYNDASSSIDNTINFLCDEINQMCDGSGNISGELFVSLCETAEGLFGVETTTKVESTQTNLDMKTGVTITVKKEYVKVNQKKDNLMSVVRFAATMSEGTAIITNELAFDRTSEVKVKEDLLKLKYNSTNLLWNYWAEQYENDINPDKTVHNPFSEKTLKGSNLYSFFYQQNDYKNGDMDIIDIVDGKYSNSNKKLTTTEFVDKIVNSARNNSDIEYYGASQGIHKFFDIRTDDWAKYNNYDIVHNSYFNRGKDSAGRDVVVIDRNVRMDSAQTWTDTSGSSLYITNNSTVFIGGSFETDANIYIERGSTLVVCGDFTVNRYLYNGAEYAPVLDADYETKTTKEAEAGGNHYVGGGVIVSGKFYYDATYSKKKNVLLNDGSRPILSDPLKNNSLENVVDNTGYVKGGFTVVGAVKIMFYADSKNESTTKLPIGVTVYSDGSELELINTGFMCTRPTLLFVAGELYLKCVASLVDNNTSSKRFGSLVPYVNEDTFKNAEKNKCGFAIITCGKFGKSNEYKGSYINFINFFYNNTEKMEEDKSHDLLKAVTQMQTTASNAIGVKNWFVSETLIGKFSDNIEADSIHWYIPSKLRGSMVAASISASQAQKA